ncbi:MAG TPA: rod shape-determining protein MreC [Candidatus Limnocylindrales bacterium]|nr:rod shape-determining protein MreC [Candidatus Limnocylindrales bacterium]
MFATRASRRRGVAFALLIAASLLLLGLSRTPPMRELERGLGFAFAPIQGAISGLTRGVTSVFDAIAEIDRLRRDNQQLQARSDALEVENRRLAEIRVQNEQLTRLLEVRSSLDYETVAAEVIGRQVSQYERMVTLDKGTDHGIAEGDVVVAGGAALVGQVVEAGANYSRILLISDTRSTVIGLVEASRATGEVRGQLGGALVMANIPSTDEVAIDDTVVTAGIDLGNGIRSPFPKGLVVGRVVDVQRDPNAVVQAAFVLPAAPLDKLEYLLVITDYEGGLPIVPPSDDPGAGPGASPTFTIAPDEGPIVLPSPTSEEAP